MNSETDGRPPLTDVTATARVLVLVEGVNDVEFVRRIGTVLHAHEASLPDLAAMEQRGELIFVPFGGGGVASWAHRFAPLAIPEFHLLDHELPPETELRRQIVEQINRRPNCRAALTRKRSLENYLSRQAILAAGGCELEFGDFDSVPETFARHLHDQDPMAPPWPLLPRRARKRMTNRAKRWLNSRAADQMTAELLAERDPDGEVRSWLVMIGRLAGRRS